jgi:hypothetical protein
MGWISDARRSPAAVVAVLALAAALGGTAFAAPDVSTSAINKKRVKKIATKQVRKLAPELSVANAETATTANSADTATTADRANTAAQAQNATTASGIRPVKINFAVPSDTPDTPLFNQGGLRLEGQCSPSGRADLEAIGAATDGLVKLATVTANDLTDSVQNLNFDVGSLVGVGTEVGIESLTVTITYRGASGTQVNGDLVIAEGAAAAQCVIAGTLFVG